MILLFDTSVWVDHLRRGVLDLLLPVVRGRFRVSMDAITAAELLAGCRTTRERREIEALTAPIRGAGRLVGPVAGDFTRAATALSRLREQGKSLRSPGGALLDGLICAISRRVGALLVTSNVSDFQMLREQMHNQVEAFEDFRQRLGVT